MERPLRNPTSSETSPILGQGNEITRVLLVEDNPSDVQLVRSALSDLSDRDFFGPIFEITRASRLSEATKFLAGEEFDVILLDLSLPDSMGFDHTFSCIHEAAATTPIIVLTGLGDESLGLRMVREGAQDYLIKSRVERYVLVKAIRYAVERQRSELTAKREQAELRLKLVTLQEQERQRMARELHDQLAQSIVALSLGLKSIAASCEPARDVHSLALDLRPTALDDLGLEMALSNYLDRWSSRWEIAADFHSQGFNGRRLASHIETTIYRITQEALTNIVRHARAKTVSLILKQAGDRVVLIIEDNGCGFDVEDVNKNTSKEQQLGLLGMEERVGLVDGTLTIESVPDFGTSVYVRIPIEVNGVENQHNG
jgi:signal transduction histidine kinase